MKSHFQLSIFIFYLILHSYTSIKLTERKTFHNVIIDEINMELLNGYLCSKLEEESSDSECFKVMENCFNFNNRSFDKIIPQITSSNKSRSKILILNITEPLIKVAYYYLSLFNANLKKYDIILLQTNDNKYVYKINTQNKVIFNSHKGNSCEQSIPVNVVNEMRSQVDECGIYDKMVNTYIEQLRYEPYYFQPIQSISIKNNINIYFEEYSIKVKKRSHDETVNFLEAPFKESIFYMNTQDYKNRTDYLEKTVNEHIETKYFEKDFKKDTVPIVELYDQ